MEGIQRFLHAVVFMGLIAPGLLSAHSFFYENNGDKPIESLSKHATANAPQKIFMHLDNLEYFAGETIWFKGYLVDGITNQPDASSANVYVELWDIQGELVKSLIAQPDAGSFYGEFLIEENIPDGNYMIRAYTDRMLKQPDYVWFHHYFYILNPEFAHRIDNSTRRFNRNFNRQLDRLREEYLVSFYPEGGNLLDGFRSLVAIKVIDVTGRGYKAEGEIIDSNGSVLTTFSTNKNGLGSFELMPLSGNHYYANIRIKDGDFKRISLPEVLTDGFSMSARLLNEETLELVINATGTGKQAGKVLLMSHNRGNVIVYEPDLEIEKTLVKQFSLKDFPTGIAHFALYSDDETPQTERLVFVNHHDQIFFDMRASAMRIGEDTAINIEILPIDLDDRPVKGEFSLAVQFAEQMDRSYDENIFSYLLLSGDLTGMIQNPGYYFDFSQQDIEKEIDILLLAYDRQWINWQRLNKSSLHDNEYYPRYGISIEGSAYDPLTSRGISDSDIILRLVADHDKSFSTMTDSDGGFSFESLPIVDSVLVEILVLDDSEGEIAPDVSLENIISGGDAPEMLPLKPNVLTRHQKVTERGSDWRRIRPERQTRDREVVRSSPYGNPDQVISPDRNITYSSIIDLLRDRSTGLSFSPDGNIVIRGPSSIGFQAPPLYIVDGVESQGAFESLDVRDVERIEIFKGGSAAVFGARGVNGALVAYTRRGEVLEQVTSENQFLIGGLHAPAEFILDMDFVSQEPDPQRPITLHWQPKLQMEEDGVGSFRFFPHKSSGQYRIVIQGIGENGKIGYGVFMLEL